MRRGAWHQVGHNGQKIVTELLDVGIGVGAIISPKDLAFENAKAYSELYRDRGAGVLLDPQFYEPEFTDGKISSYPTFEFRKSLMSLGTLSAGEKEKLATALQQENADVGADAIIAPAVPYEAARPDIVELNKQLFEVAKSVGDYLGIPTYATVVLGQSSTTEDVAQTILSNATAAPADGWYFAFEFASERLPTDIEAVYRYCSSGLTLACTGKPVLHACAGPLANLAFGSGARGAGIGIWQNLWGFERSRWQPSTGQGGGGDAPPRFFSTSIWGTIVYPDEVLQLPLPLREKLLSHTPHSEVISGSSALPWQKREASKHLVHAIAAETTPLAEGANAKSAMESTVQSLQFANALLDEARKSGIPLRDNQTGYQSAWTAAGTRALAQNSEDYEWLATLGGP